MEHVVASDIAGRVKKVAVAEGDTVDEGDTLALLEPVAVEAAAVVARQDVDIEIIRPDLEETLALPDPGEAFRYFWLLFRAAPRRRASALAPSTVVMARPWRST